MPRLTDFGEIERHCLMFGAARAASHAVERPQQVAFDGTRSTLNHAMQHSRCSSRPQFAAAPPHLSVPSLPGLIDGNLRGSIDLPWLPPSLTMLVLAAVQLRGLPGVLDHLPRLRRCVHLVFASWRGAQAASQARWQRWSCQAPCALLDGPDCRKFRAVADVLPCVYTSCSLVLDHNPGLGGSSLARLARLSALQELNLSECALHSFPRQV